MTFTAASKANESKSIFNSKASPMTFATKSKNDQSSSFFRSHPTTTNYGMSANLHSFLHDIKK